MRTLLLFLSLFYLNCAVFAQELPTRPNAYDADSLKTGEWIICYDADWNPIQNCDSASFYRLLTYEAGKPIGPGGDYYADGQVQMSFDSLISESPGRYHGRVIYYEESGAPTNCKVYKSGRRDLIASIECLRELLPKAEKQVGESHPDYATSLNNLANLLESQGDYTAAEPLYRKALATQKSVLGEQHPDYAVSLNNLASLLYHQGDYTVAEPLFRKLLATRKSVLGEQHPDYAVSLNNLASLLHYQGDYIAAEPLFRKALAIRKSALGEGHPRYATSLNNLAFLLQAQGDYTAAEPLFRKALAIRKSALGEGHPRYATSLNNLAFLLRAQGDYMAAESLYRHASAIWKTALGEDHPDYATSLNNLADLLRAQGDYAAAEPLYRKVLAVRKAALGEQHPDYAVSLNNLAGLLQNQGDYAAAEPPYRQALAIWKSALGEQHPDYATSLDNLAGLLESQGDYTAAEPLYQKASAVRKSALGESHPDYASSLNNLAELLQAQNHCKAADSLYGQASGIVLDHLEANFSNLNEAGRNRFLQTQSFYFSRYAKLLARHPESASASGLYNLQLRLKGLLLRSNQKVRRRIEASGDSVLIADYQAWNRLRGWLSNLYNMPVQQREGMGYSIDSLQNRVDSLEKALSLRSEQFASTYSPDRHTWEDVRASLGRKEAAVEMLRVELEGDSVAYLALIVSRKLKEGPKAVVIKGPRHDLDERYASYYLKSIDFDIEDKRSYDVYWRPFEEVLAPYETVYFAPAGTYYKLNLATLYDVEKDQYLSDRKSIRYVTSTQDLVKAKQRQKRKLGKSPNALLFGRPDYGEAIDSKGGKREFNIRNQAFTDLPGTEEEVNSISPMLKGKAWDVQQYIGGEASEARVSKVHNPTVLHIATHGYFVEDPTKGPMFTSGLILSEVGQEQQGLEEEDGFLTAVEAASLDLDETQLVVLSACNTGSGAVSATEGVYGLQRAFLEAGAEALIISLWPVSDAATSKFMPLFYKYWLESGDKRRAFQKAQAELREKYPSPRDWGAFVLVGA